MAGYEPTNRRKILVGRGPEMRQLSATLARVQDLASEIVTIDGEPGMGKSRLLEELSDNAAGLGWAVVRIAGHNGARSVAPGALSNPFSVADVCPSQRVAPGAWINPFSVIDGGSQQLLGPARGLLGDLSDAGSGWPDVLQRLALSSPTLLVVDDAHLLGAPTLDLLRTLAERRVQRMLIVCAFRFTTREAVIEYRHACEVEGAPTLTLRPLDNSDAHELAIETLGRGLTATEKSTLAHTSGVPVRIREMSDNFSSQSSQSLQTRLNPVPSPITPLIARETELVELARLLTLERLVTLAGSGGCGKTRLAQELARRVEPGFPGGVCWVELAPRIDEPGVIGALASAVGLVEGDNISLFDRLLTSIIATPGLLIVLDNAEHVRRVTGDLVAKLLVRAPGLRVVCTSREPLDVLGELVWRVPPLSTPVMAELQLMPSRPRSDIRASDRLAPELVAPFDSVRLFVDRAARVRRGFVLSEDNAQAIARICERLDGLPLAIELAAARVRAMSPERIAAQLDSRVELQSTVGSATSGFQTLRASIMWSEELLDENERVVFRRLGVFVGGFTIEAAHAVVTAFERAEPFIDPYAVTDIVTRLVDKSLVVFDEEHDRFFMLETIRAFAWERLEMLDELSKARDAHVDWFVDWLRTLDHIANAEDAQQFIDRTPIWMRVIASDVANCHAAFEWVETGGVRSLLLVAGLGYYWLMVAAYDEAERYGLRTVLAGDPNLPEWSEAAMWVVGAIRNCGVDGNRLIEEAALRGDSELTGRELVRIAGPLATISVGENGPTDEELARFETARAASAEVKDWYTYTNCTYIPASICAEFGLLKQAESILGLGSFSNHRMVLVEAMCALRRGRFLEAESCISHASAMVAELMNSVVEWCEVAVIDAELCLLSGDGGDRVAQLIRTVRNRSVGMFEDSRNLGEGILQLVNGDYVGARRSFTLPRRADIYRAYARTWLAPTELALGDAMAARLAAKTVLADWSHIRAPYLEASAHLVLAECEMEHSPVIALDEAHVALAAAGDHELWVEVIDSLEAIGALLLDLGRKAEGARLLGAAHAERDRMGYRHRFAHRERYVRSAHESTRSTREWAEGTTLTLGAAIELAQRMRGARMRPTVGWESLTPTELQVVELVVSGLSNVKVAEQLFVSRATVKTHLVHVYEKLDLHSRAELAAYAARQ